MDGRNNYLFVDDLMSEEEPIPKELLKSMPPIKGKVISGTFGTFNIKEFEKIMWRRKDVRILRKTQRNKKL